MKEEEFQEYVDGVLEDEATPLITKTRLKEYRKFKLRLEELDQNCKDTDLKFDYYALPLVKNGKIPSSGKRWIEERESLHQDHDYIILDIINNHGNFGIVGTHQMSVESEDENYVSLTFLDIDLDKNGEPKLPSDKLFELLRYMDTFTVQTRSGGYHLYFATKSSFIKSFKEKYRIRSKTKNPHPYYKGTDFGELRMASQYIVGAGSYVPPKSSNEKTVNNPRADGIYKVLINKPIKFIDENDFPDWINFGEKNRSRNVRKKCSEKSNSDFSDTQLNYDLIKELTDQDPDLFKNQDGITLAEIRQQNKRLDLALTNVEEYEIYKLDENKNYDRSASDWYVCKQLKKYRFSPEQAYAIFVNFRPYEKTENDNYLEFTIIKAYSEYDEFDYSPSKKFFDELPFEVKECDTFPDTLPDKKCVILNGLPRTGKSHYSLIQLGKHKSGIYVAPNYAILEKQFKKFCELYPDKKAVILYGKNRACSCTDKKNCSSCSLKPVYNSDQKKKIIENNPSLKNKVITFSELGNKAKNYCSKHNKIDLESLNSDLCKYHFLHACEEFVDFVFTIPFYTVADEEKWPHLCFKDREIMVIDEDTSIRHYMAKEVLIASLQRSNNVIKIENNLSDLVISLKEMKEKHIIKKKNFENEKIILNSIIDYLISLSKQIDDYSVSTGNNSKIDFDTLYQNLLETKPSIEGEEKLVSEVEDKLKRSALKLIEGLCSEISEHNQRASIINIFIAVLYPLSLNPLANLKTRNKNELYLIPEQYGYCRLPECAERFLLIGYTEAEIFSENLVSNPDDIQELKTDRFDYSDNFVLIVACGKNKREQKRLLDNFIQKLLRYNESEKFTCPFMVLTSSIKHQETFTSRLKNNIKLVNVQQENPFDLFLNFCIGKHIVFYQNSIISRGLDIPWIDIMFVDSCHYSLPYYRAKIEGLKRSLLDIKTEFNENSKRFKEISENCDSNDEEINSLTEERESLLEKEKNYREILSKTESNLDKLIMDESTNSMLRFSPVKDYCENNCKFLVLKEHDFDYLKEEASSKFQRFDLTNENLDEIIKLVHNYSIKIDVETATKRAIGGNLKKLISNFSEEEIKEALNNEAVDLGKSYVDLHDDLNYLSIVGDSKIYIGIKTILSHPNFFKPIKEENYSKGCSGDSLISWIKERKKDVIWSDSIIKNCLDILVDEDEFLSKYDDYDLSENKIDTTTFYYIDYEHISDIGKFMNSNFLGFYEEFMEKIDSS